MCTERPDQLQAPEYCASSAHIIPYRTAPHCPTSSCTAAAHDVCSHCCWRATAMDPGTQPRAQHASLGCHTTRSKSAARLPDWPHPAPPLSPRPAVRAAVRQTVPLCAWVKQQPLHSTLRLSQTAGPSDPRQACNLSALSPDTCAQKDAHPLLTARTPGTTAVLRQPNLSSLPVLRNCRKNLLEPAACSWPKTCPHKTPHTHSSRKPCIEDP